jgi:hypothetical protein
VDFVVVGFGLGGLAIVLGLMLGWSAASRDRAALQAALPEGAARDRALARDRRGAGQALLSAGGAVLVATIGALAGGLDDQTGAFFVTTTATVATLGILVWAYFHRSRHPAPPRARRQPRSLPAADVMPGPAAALLVADAHEATVPAELPMAWDHLADNRSPDDDPIPDERESEDDPEADPERDEEFPASAVLDDDLDEPAQPLAIEANGSLNGREAEHDGSAEPRGAVDDLVPVARDTDRPPATPEEE